MKSKVLQILSLLLVVAVFSSCGSVANCPTCGTTKNGSFAIINIIPVPQHNPTGEPGGPFNSFDISWMDPVNHRYYVSDRIGLAVVVVDTTTNVAVNTIGGANAVTQAGNNASQCFIPPPPAPQVSPIPPMLDNAGAFTRFGCRTGAFSIPGFGANGLFGGFPGAQCCAARANGVNPLSAPDGQMTTADGKTLFVANSSSSVVVFDLTTNPPTVIATIPTGQSPTWDGPNGVGPCITSANGRAFSDSTCGDLRADEMSYDEKDKILLVTNGDPGLPFATLIDMSAVVARTGNCLPVNPGLPYGPTNFPTCILGQIYYDGAPVNNSNQAVDSVALPANPPGTVQLPCPDPSTAAPSGVSGTGVGAGGKNVPCHHGPIVTAAGVFCNQVSPAGNCFGAISPAGIGGSAFNPNTGHFLLTNANATGDLTIGTIDEIDPRIGNPNGPVVINTFVVANCMPSGIVQGPGNNFLVGCANHDGVTFPPNEYVINGTTGAILANIPYVGGVDQVWFNPGDHTYYVAARDMPTGPVMGAIDANTNLWLSNSPTNANSHSIAVDPVTNHIFVPMQSGGPCGTQSSNGCIGVFARQ
jgi:YVTN family beta-propeller protein